MSDRERDYKRRRGGSRSRSPDRDRGGGEGEGEGEALAPLTDAQLALLVRRGFLLPRRDAQGGDVQAYWLHHPQVG